MAKNKGNNGTDESAQVAEAQGLPQAGTEGGAPASEATGAVATSENGAAPAAEATKTRAPAANFLSIVSGRLPLIFVHAIRFDPTLKAMGNADVATKFGTSVGKVFDVRKGRNFAYVDENWKPTAEDVAAAKDWAGKVGGNNKHGIAAGGDKTVLGDIVTQYETRGLASAEEAAAFSAARTGSRKATATKPAGVEGAPPAGDAKVVDAAALVG